MAMRAPKTGNKVAKPGFEVFLSKIKKETAIDKNPKKTSNGMYFKPMYFLVFTLEKVANIAPARNSQTLVSSE